MATIYGGAANNSLVGDSDGNFNDLFYGGGGSDILRGLTANDTLYGGTGTDLVYGNDGLDLLFGDTGNDTLYGGNDNDTLYGGNDTDSLFGDAGNDILSGDAGTDRLFGGDGTDTLFGGIGADTLYGGNDGDLVYGGDDSDVLSGNDGADTLYGDAGTDLLYGDVGDDILDGGTEADTLYGGTGNDTLYGGAGVDVLRGGDGADLIYGGTENDDLAGEAGNDTLFGGAGNDLLNGGAGNDLLVGDAGADTLVGDIGDDTLRGGDGGDVLTGGQGLDFIDYSDSNAAVLINLATSTFSGGHATGDSGSGVDGIIGSNFNDTLIGFDGSSTDPLDTYTNVIYGGLGDDSISGLDGGDSLFGGADNDTVSGDAGNDLVSGDAGRDLVYGGTGNDTVFGGADADTVYGDAGDDLVSGDAGADIVYGGTGNDTVFGGAGSDVLYGGAGRDILYGDDDADSFFVGFNTAYGTTPASNDVALNESVFGGDGGVDNDTLTVDITGFGWARMDLNYDPLNSENGVIIFYDALGNIIGTLNFTDIENVVIVCFTAGTRILTERGAVAVEELAPGDLVVTRDSGLQPLRWVGRRVLSAADLQARPELQPVRIGSGALGTAGPERTMMVSPQHRVLIEGAKAEMYFGETEVLVPAKHLVGLAEVSRSLPAEGVTYVHILFDRHEIVLSDGIWTESFQPAERTLNALDAAARTEVLELFPELSVDADAFPAARLTLRAHEAKVLIAG